ncbi:MAG: PLP-dependent transferase, partial [Rhodobacteraceae bacterium]|nr:PLP-dependent transferase [Paracoccaceae bacterium]
SSSAASDVYKRQPFNAWVMLKGLETLQLRCDEQARSCEALVTALQGHDKLAQVIYPFADDHAQQAVAKRQMSAGGTVISLDIKGGQGAAFRFLNALRIVTISNNLGDAKSLITHPATTTHQRLPLELRASLGIGDGLVRLSVGLEDSADLITDVLEALEAV